MEKGLYWPAEELGEEVGLCNRVQGETVVECEVAAGML
jgi:hypothetical protein